MLPITGSVLKGLRKWAKLFLVSTEVWAIKKLFCVHLYFDAVVKAASRTPYFLQKYGMGDYKAFVASNSILNLCVVIVIVLLGMLLSQKKVQKVISFHWIEQELCLESFV